MRMARSPDDTEEHLPSDIATLEPAGVLLLEKRRHGAGSKQRLSSTGPLTVPSGQSKSLLNSLGVALQQVKGTEMIGHTRFPWLCCIEDVSLSAVWDSSHVVYLTCACMFVLVI